MSKKVKVTEMRAGYEYRLDGEQWKERDRENQEKWGYGCSSYGKRVLCMESAYGGIPFSLDDSNITERGTWHRPPHTPSYTNMFTKDFEVTQIYDYPTFEKVRESCLPNAFYWFRIPNAARSLSNPNYIPTESEIKALIRQQNAVPWTPGNVRALVGIGFLLILMICFFPIAEFAGFCGGTAALLGLYIWSDQWDRRQIKRKGGRCV